MIFEVYGILFVCDLRLDHLNSSVTTEDQVSGLARAR